MKLKNVMGFIRSSARPIYITAENLFYCILQRRDLRTALLCVVRLKNIPSSVSFPHPLSIVIAYTSRIGPGCEIRQNVTIGRRAGHSRDPSGVPVIGCNVLIGAGAVILGAVSVGDRAKIGANAVILADVPTGCTAVGVWK